MPIRTACGVTVWPEATLAVDDGDHRCVDHDIDLHVGDDGAGLFLRGIARHADHAVAVMSPRDWR